MCHLQHVEAEGLVLRAEHTQLRHALHRPGNTASTYTNVYTQADVHARARTYSMNGAREHVFTHRLPVPLDP